MKRRAVLRSALVVALASLGSLATACSLVFGLDSHGSQGGAPPSDVLVEDAATGDAAPEASSADGAPELLPDASVDAPSCASIPPTCGWTKDRNCCDSPVVPGGTFLRDYDAVDGGPYRDNRFPATLHDFRLDRYEITRGRFRAFLSAYQQPAAGSGRNPRDREDEGWKAAWNAPDGGLPATAAEVVSAMRSCNGWKDTPDPATERRPISCITWFEAYAFCIWDGGRLPTDAEWSFAALGGAEQRAYPWSTPPEDTTIDLAHAVYANSSLVDVGSKSTAGDGRWGQADLTGSLDEWNADWFGPLPVPCLDCANHLTATSRKYRGGSWFSDADYSRPARTDYFAPTERYGTLGARCARSL